MEDRDTAEKLWLREFAPVFIQPEIDIANGHPLLRVFYEFVEDIHTGELLCELVLVYEGEASYKRTRPHRMNHFATFFYMSFNKLSFGRTADINYVTVTGVDLGAAGRGPGGISLRTPWRSLRTRDHSGPQTWAQGTKGDFFCWFSLFHHYRRDLPFDKWERENGGGRPVVYVNTQNHMMGEMNNNPAMVARKWATYALVQGGTMEAEAYARHHVPPKRVLWAPFRRPPHSTGSLYRFFFWRRQATSADLCLNRCCRSSQTLVELST